VRPYRQQVAAGAGLAPDAAAEANIYSSSGRESSSTWQVHEVAPVSPSTRAGVALSNLSLLQQLSNGQLQAALEEANSPHKAQQQQQQQQQRVAQDWQQQQQVEEEWQQQAQQQHWQQVELLQQQQQQQQQDINTQEGGSAKAAYCMNPWPGAAETAIQRSAAGKPQTPDTPRSAAAAAAAEYAAAPLRSSMDATSNAAAALQAAAAAVHRMPPSPYGRNLGVQRYAADAAALCNSNSSQDYSLLVAGAWGGAGNRQEDAATAGARSPTRWYAASASPGSPTYVQQSHDATQQQLHGLLSVSAAAAAGTAAVLDAAGEMLAPYNAPSAGLAQQQVMLQQQQQQVVLSLGPVLDPVAQALQGEVQQLRQEVSALHTSHAARHKI
jgi:hypothetical protein